MNKNKTTFLLLSLYLVCFGFAVGQVSPLSNSTSISGEYSNQPLKDVLKDLEKRLEISFTYVDEVIAGININEDFASSNLEEVLTAILSSNGISFKRVDDKRYVIYKSPNQGEAGFTIFGVVSKSHTKEPVAFANIYIRKLQRGMVASANGAYKLENVPYGPHRMEISAVGFQTRVVDINVTENAELDIQLDELVFELQGVEITPGVFELTTPAGNAFNLSKAELISPPNLAKDLLKNMKSVPGVANDDISAKARIRGGDWDETAIFYDNLELYEPFHLEEVNGFAGIFDIELITNTKILTGGFSSRYTDKMSGIVEVATASYLADNKASFSVDLLGLSAQMQKKVGANLDIISSVRRGYLDLFVRAETNGIKPRYFDAYFKGLHRLTPKNHLSYHLLLSRDDLEFRTDLAILRPEFYTSLRNNLYSWVNWKWLPTAKFSSQSTIGYQLLKKDSDFQFESSITNNNVDDRNAGIFSWSNRNFWNPSNKHNVEFGFEFKGYTSDYRFKETRIDQLRSSADTTFTHFINLDTRVEGYTFSQYLQNTWLPSNKLGVNGGLRVSTHSHTGNVFIAPRSSLSYWLHKDLNLKLAYGWYYQADNFQKLRAYENQQRLSKEVMKSVHYVGSVQFNKNNLELLLSAYYKNYPRLFSDYRFDFYNRASLVNVIDDQDFNTESGHSKGMELFIRGKLKSGFLSVNYTYAQNKIANAEGTEVYRDYDRRHSINTNAVLTARKGYTFSSTWTYHSGDPYTESQVRLVNQDSSDPLIYYDLGVKNSLRLPAFHSLDIKIEKVWIGRTAKTLYLNIVNLYNRHNTRNFHWEGELNAMGETEAVLVEIGLPTFFISPGFKWEF